MSDNAIVKREVYSLQPQTFAEMQEACALVAKSMIIPEAYRGKPADIFVAASMGMEVGLSFLQSLQGIAVINGRPTIWGDHAIALVRASGKCEYIDETWDEAKLIATCKVKRKGEPVEIVRTFSLEDATRAGLDQKTGPWKGYDQRMCQMRARSWALRDGFADVLRGIGIAEEMRDVIDSNPDNDKARVEEDIPMPRATDEPVKQIEAQSPGRTIADLGVDQQQPAREPVRGSKDPAPTKTARTRAAAPAPTPNPAPEANGAAPAAEPERVEDPAASAPVDAEVVGTEDAPGGVAGTIPAEDAPAVAQTIAEELGDPAVASEILAQAACPTEGPYSAMRVGRVTSRKGDEGTIYMIYLLDDTNTEMRLATTDKARAQVCAQAKLDGKTVSVRFLIHSTWGWELIGCIANP